MSNLKFACLIQGPMNSYGRTGEDMRIGTAQMDPSHDYVNYDCNNNVLNLVKKFKKRFSKMILVTWISEIVKEEIIDIIDVFQISKPVQEKPYYLNPKKKDTRFFQYKSTLFGIEKLNSLDVDYIIKLRTDQYVALDNLIDFLEKQLETKDLYFPNIFTNSNKLSVHDFYIVGRPNQIKRLYSMSNYEHFIFSISPHSDIISRYLFAKYNIQFNNKKIFFSIRNSISLKKQIFKLIENEIAPLPQKVFESLTWRGKKVKHLPENKYIFYDKWPEKSKELKNQLKFDYKTYDCENYINYCYYALDVKTNITIKLMCYLRVKTSKFIYKIKTTIKHFLKKSF